MNNSEEYSKEHEKMMHKAIKKVSSDIEEMKFNTSVATFMAMINVFYKDKFITKAELKTFLQLLNPFAPHITEEMWQKLGEKDELSYHKWPEFDEEKTVEDLINLPIQINGKLRANVEIQKDEEQDSIKEKILKNDKIKSYVDGKTIVKEIYVPNKIYNIVVK